ncbi:MAG: PIN domain-containing protein [Sulfurimonas sp.]|jgi:predicted nucleic acid-binding protein|nr:PIN domain-containing protein [Sulfurimonas sp.]
MSKVFFDANIINDIYDSKRATAEASYLCLKQCLEEGYDIVTSCDIVTNVYYITSKYTDKINALDALEDIEALFTILPFENSLLKDAVVLMKKDSSYDDLEDTIQYLLAKQNSCEMIVSNDKKFVSKDVKLYSAEAFLKTLQT